MATMNDISWARKIRLYRVLKVVQIPFPAVGSAVGVLFKSAKVRESP